MANWSSPSLIRFHQAHGKATTVTAVTPPGCFGTLELDGEHVIEFTEKPTGDIGLVPATTSRSPTCLNDR